VQALHSRSTSRLDRDSCRDPGVARVTACATLPPEVDAYRRQECEAVNFVARNPSLRPAFSIDRANDPLISRANAVARHPTMASTGVTAGRGAENCRVVTETTPASVTRETCSDYRPVTSKSCSTVRQIQVDQHHRYQCVEQMPDDCAAIKATEGCVLVGSTCDSTASTGRAINTRASIGAPT
jgi:quinol monooxygenase YgiN